MAAATLKVAWRRREFRQSVAAAALLWGATGLLCCLPLRGERPVVDVSAGTAAVVSTLMDATGIVHLLSSDPLRIAQPGNMVAVDSVTQMAGLLAAAFLVCLWHAAARELPIRQLTALLASALAAVLMANGLLLYFACLLFALAGLDLTAGLSGLTATVLRVFLAGGLLSVQAQGLSWISSAWTYQQTLRRVGESGELPVRLSRRGRPQATLVAAIDLGVFAVWVFGCGITQETIITAYRLAADQGLSNQNLPAATVAVDRLLQLDPAAPPHRLLKARLLESTGNFDAAEKMVRELVESGGRHFAPAHRWLADSIVHKRSSATDSEFGGAAQSIERLTAAVDLDPNDVNAHVALAEAYLARRSPRQAIRELEQVVKTRPDLRITLARLLVIAGELEKGREQGALSRDHYQEEVNVYPMAREPRIQLAASLLFLEEFQRAISVLLAGTELSDDPFYHEAVGATYVAWHDTAARSGTAKTRLLSLLEKSLEYSSDNAEALERVTVLATEEGEEGPAVDLLTQSLDGRPIPAGVHCVLGTNAFRHGRIENALRHLEEAYRLDPTDLETLNNLAWALAHSDSALLDRALELADEAVRRYPHLASPRETRGQILAKLGHWSRAVADLENAMQVMRNNPSIHATLADAYKELGDESLAADHRRMASETRQTH